MVSNLTLLENVAVSGFFAGIKNSTNLAKELLEQIGLSKVMDNLPGQVSGGEAQRCAVARAVMGNPQILFADEPTGALNKKKHGNHFRFIKLFQFPGTIYYYGYT